MSLTDFAYNNFIHVFADVLLFYLIYEYNSETHYKIEDDFIKEEISFAKEQVR